MTLMKKVLPSIDYLFCDEREALNLTETQVLEDAANVLRDAGVGTVIVKRGENGSDLFGDCWNCHEPSVMRGELVDSIGAGDAFDAAFLVALLEGRPVQARARFASIVAGCTVTAPGGYEGMPDRRQAAEIEAGLAGNQG